MKKLAVCALCLAFGFTSSCATLLKGTTEQIAIDSAPTDANLEINNQPVGATPYVANVPSKEDLRIHVEKAGYQPVDVTDGTSFRWGYEIWSFLEFVLPLGVDLADGAAWGHDDTAIAVHLEPIAQNTPAAQQPAAASGSPAPAAAIPQPTP